jgi:hypothetical protein
MATIGEKITALALEQLKSHPDGTRYSKLVDLIKKTDPGLNTNTIHGTIWDLASRLPKKVYKPSRGLFRLVEFKETNTDQLKAELVPQPVKKTKEEDFYAPFADWLVNDLEDCTKAIPLGGNKFHDKWTTPDVVGKRESKKGDMLQAPTEIVSAEIKTNVSELVTAFGQACAYCLFSHKSYLVVPQTSPQDEIDRLDSLCQVFGIGLILFDGSSPENPDFSIRVRPRKQEPDMFYVNKYMRLIESELWP